MLTFNSSLKSLYLVFILYNQQLNIQSNLANDYLEVTYLSFYLRNFENSSLSFSWFSESHVQQCSSAANRIIIIDYQLLLIIMKYSKCLLYYPFLTIQLKQFSVLNSRISANPDKEEGNSDNSKIPIKGIITLLQNLFCAALTK